MGHIYLLGAILLLQIKRISAALLRPEMNLRAQYYSNLKAQATPAPKAELPQATLKQGVWLHAPLRAVLHMLCEDKLLHP